MTATQAAKPTATTEAPASEQRSTELTDPEPGEAYSAPALLLDLQQGSLSPRQSSALPTASDLERWALAALAPGLSPRHAQRHWPAELTIRITDEAESSALNQQFRGRSGPTNILSFPFALPPGIDATDPAVAGLGALLGDLVICAPLVQREAAEQGKTETAHWAHLVVHGTLHLLGFDHITPTEAAPMEALEIHILGTLGFPSPYEVNDDANGER
ncbi:MAG: rRNA maturation RNase YbeY [Lamprobacter sp.]|uniref:rRNA maturation RNase YbeY n=1 Tax=Lamprobacter sp. TaxID=3100796 RepID=UPI002B257758|nr:rRNA maturation RNase YbeY [Lamprobacter sp.]MEA3638936.1 rRNA maturation RNase YbeY [Lamprobacter sp.]